MNPVQKNNLNKHFNKNSGMVVLYGMKKWFTPAPKLFSVSSQDERGFTLIEILIVIVILATIVTIVVSAFSRFDNNQSLQSATAKIVTALDEARSKTLASYDNSVYGVHLQSDKAVLFKGETFSPLSSDNEDFIFSSKISISEISLSGGGDEIIFKRLMGKTDQDGIITLSLISDSSKFKTITIQSSGIIEQ